MKTICNQLDKKSFLYQAIGETLCPQQVQKASEELQSRSKEFVEGVKARWHQFIDSETTKSYIGFTGYAIVSLGLIFASFQIAMSS